MVTVDPNANLRERIALYLNGSRTAGSAHAMTARDLYIARKEARAGGLRDARAHGSSPTIARTDNLSETRSLAPLAPVRTQPTGRAS